MKNLFIVSCVFIMFCSCGEDTKIQTSNAKNHLLALINGKNKISAFGKVQIDRIIDKIEIQNFPMIGLIADGIIQENKELLNLNNPIYYALETINNNGSGNLYLIADIQSKDLIIDKLEQFGFNFQNENGIDLADFDNQFIGISENTIVAAVTNDKSVNLSNKIYEVLNAKIEGQADPLFDKIMASKSDLVNVFHLGKIYSSVKSNELNSTLAFPELEKEISSALVQSDVNFNNGELSMISTHHFSSRLKEMMCLKQSSNNWIYNLKGGKPTMGYAMNLDVSQLQKNILQFYPDLMKVMSASLNNSGMSFDPNNLISEIVTGQIGIVMSGIEKPNESIVSNSLLPYSLINKGIFNVFVGLGENGKQLFNQMASILAMNEKLNYQITDDGLLIKRTQVGKSMDNVDLEMDSKFGFFGKKGVSAFIDFVELKSLVGNTAPQEEEFFKLFDYLTFEMDENGSKLLISMKNKTANILVQFREAVYNIMVNQANNSSLIDEIL